MPRLPSVGENVLTATACSTLGGAAAAAARRASAAPLGKLRSQIGTCALSPVPLRLLLALLLFEPGALVLVPAEVPSALRQLLLLPTVL